MTSQFDEEINQLVVRSFAANHAKSDFLPGETSIPVTGKVFGPEEISNAVRASLEFWLTSGPYSLDFESRFAKVVGMR
ncbi:MAG TPA: lipopolysaccharide biosynthesis protein RfbH, partial [Actinobacteria bacterium]|nr:lipopolysaccharide biosynthesis protein RfbH [Actinomycetota bacterium]